MTDKIITDAQVESHIAKLREMAGSTDLKEMIRTELRYCDSAYAWHRRTREFCARFGVWYVTALTGIASGLGLHYWIADNFGPWPLEPLSLPACRSPSAALFGFAVTERRQA